MTVAVGEKKKMAENKSKINKVLPHEYGCEILLEKTTLEKAKDSSFPSDAYLIWYSVDGEQHIDLCRTVKRVNLFDMYYDKYGPGSVQKIDFGYGRVNPKLWGYKQPEKKKRK
jgi:hypothetical protein